jgi:hypothetical protein
MKRGKTSVTDDLVKRLRLIGEKRLQCTACYKFIDTADEAADRIEKLEAALRKYADEEYNGYNADGAHARKALEGEDETAGG